MSYWLNNQNRNKPRRKAWSVFFTILVVLVLAAVAAYGIYFIVGLAELLNGCSGPTPKEWCA